MKDEDTNELAMEYSAAMDDVCSTEEDTIDTVALIHRPIDDVLNIDRMYDTIEDTLYAMENIKITGDIVEGARAISNTMQAHCTKKYIPDTELEMVHTNAVPMTDADLRALQQQIEKQKTLQYRQSVLDNENKTLAEITGARVRVAYRIARYFTHIRGIGSIGVPLSFSMTADNPQLNLYEIPFPYNPTVGWYRGLAAVRNLLAEIEENTNGYAYQYSYIINNKPVSTHGMSILPPPIHDGYFPQDSTPKWEYRRTKYTPKEYDPDKDAPLAYYLNICELLVRHLGIADVDVDEKAAVSALLNPKIARLSWPCRDDLETFEEYVLMPYVGRIVINKASDSAITTLQEELSLTYSEAYDYVEMYKTYAQHAHIYDPVKERSVMLGKLDRLAEDCNEAGMVTTQHNVMKTIMQTLGLTRQVEDTNVDIRQGYEKALESAITQEKEEVIANKAAKNLIEP